MFLTQKTFKWLLAKLLHYVLASQHIERVFFYFVEDGFSCSYRINQIMQKPIVAQVQMNLVKEERKAEHSFRTINKNWKKMF